MKLSFNPIVILALALCLCRCSDDRSKQNSTHRLGTDEDSFLQFCTEFPGAQECNAINSEADNLGLARYFGGGDDFFSDRAFSNSGIGCGCESDEHPVLYRGVRRCEPQQIFTQIQSQQVVLRYVSRPDGQEKLWVAFDRSTRQTQQISDIRSSCPMDFGSRCRLANGDSDCRGLINPAGFRIEARCFPLEGQDYGYCHEQSLGQRVTF